MYFHWMEKEYVYTIIQCQHNHSYSECASDLSNFWYMEENNKAYPIYSATTIYR